MSKTRLNRNNSYTAAPRILRPKTEVASPKKSKRLVRIMVQTVLAGEEAMWRTRCDLAASSDDAKVAVGRKVKLKAKVCAVMQQIKRTKLAHLTEANLGTHNE